MARINIPKKYLAEFVNADEIRRLVPNGTMPADLAAIRKVIAAKLGDRKFLETFVNDCIKAGEIRVSMK
jgi:hypothetical protein